MICHGYKIYEIIYYTFKILCNQKSLLNSRKNEEDLAIVNIYPGELWKERGLKINMAVTLST